MAGAIKNVKNKNNIIENSKPGKVKHLNQTFDAGRDLNRPGT